MQLLRDATIRASIRRRLLAWFAEHARDLPWRRRRDPYAVWVSEVMLQQTQAATVIGYFERFVQQFPDVAALAAADEQQVLRAWEGLGYYRRARSLHRAARQLCRDHAGHIPDDAQSLGRLPGLGRYTVNAILSQAYERRLPILETNSRRVLCRLLGERGDPAAAPVQQRLWAAATALLPRRRIGDFNQALMELGALICTPDQPACARCPLARHCRACRQGAQADIPRPAKRPPVEEVNEVAVAVWRQRRVLLVQCPEAGRWAGMWELPRRAVTARSTPDRIAHQLLSELGIDADLGPQLTTVRHGVTRFRIQLICLEATHRRGSFRPGLYPAGHWVAPPELAAYPLSAPQRRLAQALAVHCH
ncbi:MAG: A/G-specific adenine glycosylase [Gemmataceae bacterium]|nr:A/G-specific adenine glycosylase [Gemmataceae bacterium]